MHSPQAKLISSITTKFIILLFLLGSIAIVEYFIFRFQIDFGSSSGTVINISGRQRMLLRETGANTAFLSLPQNPDKTKQLKEQLIVDIQTLQRSHHALIYGDPKLGLLALTSKSILSIYFEPPYFLDKNIREYLFHLKALVKTSYSGFANESPHLEFVLTELTQQKIMRGLELVVQKHTEENKNTTRLISIFQTAQLIFQITLLLFTGFFLLRPLITAMKQQMEGLETNTKQLQESEQRLKEAEFIAHLGYWDWDIFENTLYWSDETYRIFGLLPKEVEVTFDTYLNYIHPDDRKMVDAAVSESLEYNIPYDVEHRIILSDKQEKIVHGRGTVSCNEANESIRLFGTVNDITQLKKSEKLLTITNEAYSRFVPREFLKLLEKPSILDVKQGDQIKKNMTILFADIRDYTKLSERMLLEQNFNFINSYLSLMEPVIKAHHGIIDKYIGDSIMALFPLGAANAVHCAIDMLKKLAVFNQENNSNPSLQIGIGLNMGSLMLGIIGGSTRMDGTVIGDAVNLASRIESMTKVYHTPLLISEHIYFALPEEETTHIRFIDRVTAKGKSKAVSVYEVFTADPPEIKKKKSEMRVIFEEALCLYHFKQISEATNLFDFYLKNNPEDYIAQIYKTRCQNYEKTGVHLGVDEIKSAPVWDGKLLLNVPLIDDQHIQLFQQIHKLVEAIFAGRGQEKLESILGFLEHYSSKHFKEEEKLMLRTGYPYISEHMNMHSHFIKTLETLRKDQRKKGANSLHLLLRVHSQVTDWLISHIQHVDTKLRDYLVLNGLSVDKLPSV